MNQLCRTLLLCGATALALSGCRSCAERPAPPPKGEKRPSALSSISEPANTRLQALWKDASTGVRSVKADPGKEMVRYQAVRDCKLGYQLRYLQLSEVAEGRKPTGSELTARLVAEPVVEAKHSMRYSVQSTSVARIIDGALSKTQPGATQGIAMVTTDGGQWQEVDGPHLLWSVFTTQPPLDLTHPMLPARPYIGFEGLWKQRYFPIAAAKQLIARRRSRHGRQTPNAQPLFREVEVSVGGWIRMTGPPGPPFAGTASSASAASPPASAVASSANASPPPASGVLPSASVAPPAASAAASAGIALPSASAARPAFSASADPAVSPSSAALAPTTSGAPASSASTAITPTPTPTSSASSNSGKPVSERAVVVVASWVVEDVTDAPLPHEKLERYKGRFVISEHGYVLHAVVLGRARHWWSPRPGESNEKQSVNEYELRLLNSCGGIALTPARPGQRLQLE